MKVNEKKYVLPGSLLLPHVNFSREETTLPRQRSNDRKSYPDFQVGDLVLVERRCWIGMNKEGGVGKITARHEPENISSIEGSDSEEEIQRLPNYDVTYVLGGKELHVPVKYISIKRFEDATEKPRSTMGRCRSGFKLLASFKSVIVFLDVFPLFVIASTTNSRSILNRLSNISPEEISAKSQNHLFKPLILNPTVIKRQRPMRSRAQYGNQKQGNQLQGFYPKFTPQYISLFFALYSCSIGSLLSLLTCLGSSSRSLIFEAKDFLSFCGIG